MAKNEIDEQDKEQDDDSSAKKSGLSTVKIIIIAVTLTLLLGGGLVGGTYYFVSSMLDDDSSSKKVKSKKASDDEDEDEDGEEEDEDDEEEDEEDEEEEDESSSDSPATYHSMDPKFIVSFSNQKYARFMQFSLEIMSRNKDAIATIETHMPVVRSNLLMLFGSQKYEVMVTREGKEKLLTDVALDINTTIQKVTGAKKRPSSVEAAYFTSFVIQ